MGRDRPADELVAPPLHDSFERLLRVARSARRHVDFVHRAGLGDHPLTRGETFVLAEIISHAPVRPSDLAATIGLDRSITSRQVDALVRAGLVDRNPDPSDGRAALLAPTRRGRSAASRLRVERERWLTEVVATLDPSDVDGLTRLLPVLVAAIEASEADSN